MNTRGVRRCSAPAGASWNFSVQALPNLIDREPRNLTHIKYVRVENPTRRGEHLLGLNPLQSYAIP